MNSRNGIVIYLAVMGAVVTTAGIGTRGWWATVVGLLLLGAATAAVLGRGEGTSWLRGELDERRQHAADRSFRIAFLVLAWWVAALSVVATTRDLPLPAWAGGIVLALVAASLSYSVFLRRN